MDCDRGTPARIDRKVVSGLGHDESYRTVRLPVSEATWSTWKRYCDSVGISMGRGVMGLIGNELRSVIAESTGDKGPVFAGLAEKRLSEWTRRLRTREGELETRERRVETASKLAARRRDAARKVGRNEPCPCGSGLKYKHCHGVVGRQGSSLAR